MVSCWKQDSLLPVQLPIKIKMCFEKTLETQYLESVKLFCFDFTEELGGRALKQLILKLIVLLFIIQIIREHKMVQNSTMCCTDINIHVRYNRMKH